MGRGCGVRREIHHSLRRAFATFLSGFPLEPNFISCKPYEMSDLSDVRALAFDVFGTTVDWCSGVAREAKAMLEPKGYSLDWAAFAVRWRKEYQPAMEAVRSGGRGYVILDTLH